jgi:putative proteasome-type protease
MTFEDTVKLLLVSFDSTVKSNLSVGLPFDIVLYEKDAFEIHKRARVEADDLVYHQISNGWGDALKEAFVSLPTYKL